ncbi:MAG: PilW family protein [Gammaproteobacteria bacterium]|nr:PilW family protein [Gammaproteobacteria bacterium]
MSPLRQTGMTLVELMLASFISLILLAGMGQIFLSTKQLYVGDTEQSDMQDTARYLFHYIGEQVQQAGMVGCAKLDGNHYTSSIAAYDNTYFHPFHIGIQGFLKGSSVLPAVLDSLPILSGSDVVVVRRATEQGFRLVKQKSDSMFYAEYLSSAPNSCNGADKINGICADDILIAVDCQKGRSFVVSNIATAQDNGTTIVEIEHVANNNPGNWGGPGSSTPLDKFDVRDTVLNKAATTAYYLTTNDTFYAKVNDDNARPLASGIEYMRVLYGLDSDGDGSVNKFLSANQISADPTVADNYNSVVSLQIAILVRSQKTVLTADELATTPATVDYTLLDSTISKTVDGYIRKVYTSTIQLRNGGA